MIDPYSFLSQSGFFKDFSEESRQRLAAVAFSKELPKKAVLFHEGEQGRWVYLLASGRIQLHRTTPDGKEAVIKVVVPGELFAEAVLFERPDYPVTSTALADSLLLRIAKSDVQDLLARADFRNDFIAGLMQKMRFLTARIAELKTDDVAERLLAFLRDQLGGASEGELPLTKQAVANAVGITPETLSRTLQKLAKEGRLSWKGRRVSIC